MATKIDPEVLNLKEPTERVRPGVFLSAMRKTAVVVRVKDGMCAYVALTDACRIELVTAPVYAFVRDFVLCLPNYPARRALRAYNGMRLPITPEAAKVLRVVLAS